ncbi:MAG: hypothetical protein QOD86_3099 [Miltoncostaeaceae bacterium]|jgi:rubrerythrin|nr:hypothetical protein [Miltoncostaeaceae bacterium]
MIATSRGEFLSRGAKGGLVLVVGGSLLAVAAGPALGQGGGDADIAALAATAELLAIDFYGQAIGQGGFEGTELAYLEAAKQNEQDHYDALADVLGDKAPKGVAFKYPNGTFASTKSIAATGAALETAFVGAYMGAVSALTSNELKGVAALIGANEAQHLATFRRLEAGAFVGNPSLPRVLTADQALAAVTPFLA